MLHDRASILTLESEGQVIVELRVFGWDCAVKAAAALRENHGFQPEDPVCFIYIESKMNYDTVYQQTD